MTFQARSELRRSIDETPNRAPAKHTERKSHRWDDYESLSHSKWECKYHVVFIPNYRAETSVCRVATAPGGTVPKASRAEKESGIEEGHLLLDHVHMLISIPPKYAMWPADWIYQGKECDTFSSRVWGKEAKFRRPAVLGEGVFRIYGGAGHRGDTGLHQEARRGGQAP